MKKISLILPVEDILNDTSVYKITGEKRYTLRDKLKIYGIEEELPEVSEVSLKNGKFIIAENSVEFVPNDKLLRIEFGNYDELMGFACLKAESELTC